MTREGTRCHECPDVARIQRNCPMPLRDVLPMGYSDTRDPSAVPRCPVLGYDWSGKPTEHDAGMRGRYMWLMDLGRRIEDRITDAESVSAVDYEAARTVVYQHMRARDEDARRQAKIDAMLGGGRG